MPLLLEMLVWQIKIDQVQDCSGILKTRKTGHAENTELKDFFLAQQERDDMLQVKTKTTSQLEPR